MRFLKEFGILGRIHQKIVFFASQDARRNRILGRLLPLFATSIIIFNTAKTQAAVILYVHSEKKKVIVNLDPPEMADLILKVEVPVEVLLAEESYFIYVTPVNLNPLKRTVVLELGVDDENDEDLQFIDKIKPKQKIRFLPHHHQMFSSSSLHSPSHYGRFQNPLALASGGVIVEQLSRTKIKSNENLLGIGYEAHVVGSIMAVPKLFQTSLGIRGRDIQIKKSITSKVENQVSFDVKDRYEMTAIEPNASFIMDENYILGLRYDWQGIRETESNEQQSFVYNYTVAQPVVSFTLKDLNGEKTVSLKGGDRVTGSLSNRNFYSIVSPQKKVNLPASIEFEYRKLINPRWNWSFGVGYMFNQFKDEKTSRKPQPLELGLLNSHLEHYLAHGDKIDIQWAYRGAKAAGLSRLFQETNTMTLGFNWENPAEDQWFWSWGILLEGGQWALTPSEEKELDQDANAQNANMKSLSVGTMAVFHLQKEFVPGQKRRTPRRR
jgi:hypothetical protein